MKTIVIAAQKGGAGKTTIAVHLAVAAQRSAILDLDPQQSALAWHDQRDWADPPVLTREPQPGRRSIADIDPEEFDFLIVDTPPHSKDTADRALRVVAQEGGFVLLPVRPAWIDLKATQATVHRLRKYRVPFALVLNAAPPPRGFAEHRDVFAVRRLATEHQIPIYPGQITDRIAFSRSLQFGQAVTEYGTDQAAAAEIRDLWSFVLEQLAEKQEVGNVG